jgi:hypothetical protein
MKTHKIFMGELLLAFIFTVSLLPATLASAVIGGQPDENRHPYRGRAHKMCSTLKCSLTRRRIPRPASVTTQ